MIVRSAAQENMREPMARNVEIKAHARAFARQSELAEGLATRPPELLEQVDTFYAVPRGRLKLRESAEGSAELIQYRRVDSREPSTSDYVRVPVPDAVSLKAALANALGIRAVITKTRRLLWVDRTRIHLDQVETLGEFIELEVVLAEDEKEADGVSIAQALMKALEIEADDLLARAYVDLLESAASPGSATQGEEMHKTRCPWCGEDPLYRASTTGNGACPCTTTSCSSSSSCSKEPRPGSAG